MFIGFIAALVVIAPITITTYRSARQALADDRLVAHTYQVLETLQEVLVTLVDVETIVRGYIITGQEAFLEPYGPALEQLPNRLRDFRRSPRTTPANRSVC